jgi:NAD(P)H-hydrate repair Nnr-like enzyme with NAD(P)H-hydrate epimerase domain
VLRRLTALFFRSRFDFVIDAIFGFIFRGAPRPPFDALLRLAAAPGAPPVASIDIPSGALPDRRGASRCHVRAEPRALRRRLGRGAR